MERLKFASGVLFFIAATLALTSIALPEWLISEIRDSVSGPYRYGLLQFCISIAGREGRDCFFPPIGYSWLLVFVFVIGGCVCSLVASVLLIFIRRLPRLQRLAPWFGLSATVLFCTAAILFPAGFGRIEVGGSAYQLPRNCRIGISYILFILSLWLVIISEVFAGRFCTVRF